MGGFVIGVKNVEVPVYANMGKTGHSADPVGVPAFASTGTSVVVVSYVDRQRRKSELEISTTSQIC